MNTKFMKPVSGGSAIAKRITLYTPGVFHENSKYKSIPGTTINHHFFLTPTQTDGIYVRRYWCNGCSECQLLNFLSCKNESCGPWHFHKFQLKKGIKVLRSDHIKSEVLNSSKKPRRLSKEDNQIPRKLKKRKLIVYE